MLFVLQPGTIVNVTIGIVSHTMAVGFSALELTFVSALVWVYHQTISFDLVLDELSLVDLARIGEVVFTLSMELSVNKVTLIGTSFELELALSGLLTLDEVSGILDLVIVPDL